MRGYLIPLLLILIAVAAILSASPSLDRPWSTEQAILPTAEVKDNVATIHNIRNFSYTSATEFTPAYYDKAFDLNKIKRVWYAMVPFPGVPGSAHTFLSFEFEGDQFLAVSVEARREQDESYNSIKGLFNNYELIYVLADERDVIKLRTNYHKNSVYLYPTQASPEDARNLFIEILKRVNQLANQPEFYNTITNSCTTNIVNHINTLTPNRVPLFNLRILFPANSDKLAYKLNLLDTNLSIQDAREKYFINHRALKYAEDSNFSLKIRATD